MDILMPFTFIPGDRRAIIINFSEARCELMEKITPCIRKTVPS